MYDTWGTVETGENYNLVNCSRFYLRQGLENNEEKAYKENVLAPSLITGDLIDRLVCQGYG